jgi:mRNA interferase RelE/StbE
VRAPRRYRVELSPAARGQLRKLNQQIARHVLRALTLLQEDPRPHGCRAMVGQPGRWRIRPSGAGDDYRIVYEINDDVLLVLVATIAHRSEVYRG